MVFADLVHAGASELMRSAYGFQSPGHPERDSRAFDLVLRLTTDFASTLPRSPDDP
jgi:hypothetical protein